MSFPIDPQTSISTSRLLCLYHQDTNRMSDAERDAFLDERERLTWILVQRRGHGTADMVTKLAILCQRLRGDLGRGCMPGPVTNYLLAESIRDDLDAVAEL